MWRVLWIMPYGLICYLIGTKIQEWLQADYKAWLDSPNRYYFYIPPYDFSWWHFGITCFLVGMIILSLIGLIFAIKDEKQKYTQGFTERK